VIEEHVMAHEDAGHYAAKHAGAKPDKKMDSGYVKKCRLCY